MIILRCMRCDIVCLLWHSLLFVPRLSSATSINIYKSKEKKQYIYIYRKKEIKKKKKNSSVLTPKAWMGS
jgi:hypothetical protein